MEDVTAEVRITSQYCEVFVDNRVIADSEMFKDLFGFYPPDGDYEITFKLVNEIKQPEYDDCGRLIGD